SPHQVETRKSLYQEFGLLYVVPNSDILTLTAVGEQLFSLLGAAPPAQPTEELRLKVDSLLCWAMAHCQINRPQAFGTPRPSGADRSLCELRPYAAFWQAVLDLGGQIAWTEFANILSITRTVEDYFEAIQSILEIRQGAKPMPPAPVRGSGEGNYRIYWTDHLTVAASVMSFTGGEFRFLPSREPMVREMLSFNGCSGSPGAAIRAASWSDIRDYYSNISGIACPPYLASGSPLQTNIGNSQLQLLKGYALMRAAGRRFIEGGAELCSYKIATQCFHKDHPARLLRVSGKEVLGTNRIRIMLEAARPVLNLESMLALWEAQ
ncbi:MAG TPA: hypothetical protein VHI52_19655, partial [Verrucomicrobiae bacterium]|nr:hypothetical protein [Verrucomicrobiae bacterium]